jgi:hypothetical protein
MIFYSRYFSKSGIHNGIQGVGVGGEGYHNIKGLGSNDQIVWQKLFLGL